MPALFSKNPRKSKSLVSLPSENNSAKSLTSALHSRDALKKKNRVSWNEETDLIECVAYEEEKQVSIRNILEILRKK